MAHLFSAVKALKQFLFNIWYFRRNLKLKKINKGLKNGIENRNKEQYQLLQEILKVIRKKTKKGRSKFIPLTKKSKIKIKAMIEADFGEQMKRCNLKITDDLKIV